MPPPAPTPAPTPAPAPKRKLYRALTPIEDGTGRTEEGKTLRLDEKTAAPLLAINAIEPASADKEEAAE